MDATRLRFLSLWAINDSLDIVVLTEQLNAMKASGLEGVVFHPRFYPNEPVYMSDAYLRIVSELILYAKKIGMAFWIYDENGWPSGTASGQVIARRPDLICEWVEWNRTPVGEYEAVIRSKSGVSSLDPEATALFIEITHEGYRRGLSPEAFEHVAGFFTDEVAFLDGHSVSVMQGAVPWSERFPSMYRERYGEELLPLLPLLFENAEGSAIVRSRYWELATDALVEGFYRPIQRWCEANGKSFTGHLKGEENPFFQLSYSGSCFHVLKDLSMPAIDALERFPGNNFYPRIVHSLSVQQGRDSCLVEAHGGSGWGVTPETFSNYILWLAGHGLETFVLHLSQYRLKSQAVYDWPPSMPFHLTWREAFPSVLADIRRKATELPDLRLNEPELLIVTPTRGVMEAFDPCDAMVINGHDGSGVPDTKSGAISNAFMELVQACHDAGIHYELTEERAVEEIGIVASGTLRIGKRAYHKVLIADGCAWSALPSGNTVVEKLRIAGLTVLSPRDWYRSFPEFRPSAEWRLSAQTLEVEQSAWQTSMPASNQLLLVFRESSEGLLKTEVETGKLGTDNEITLVLLDEPSAVSVNGQPLSGEFVEGRYRYSMPKREFRENGTVVIELTVGLGAESNPVAFLEGSFTVESRSPFRSLDERQMTTKGPFILADPRIPNASDLIASGLSFCGLPAELRKSIRMEQSFDGYLQLSNVQGDAAMVRLDGCDIGWCWGPDWRLDLPFAVAEGEHELTVSLLPSTFNVYGPHRHVDGDRHLVSPDQYRGIKNFADFKDAPDCTLGDRWHFVKWGMTGDVLFLSR